MFYKKILPFLSTLVLLTTFHSLNADNSGDTQQYFSQYSFDAPKSMYIENELSLDLSKLDKNLKNRFGYSELIYQWDITKEDTQEGVKFQKKFETAGEYKISISIYSSENSEKKLLHNKVFTTYVYKKSFPLLVSDQVPQSILDTYIKDAQLQGVHIELIGQYSEQDINQNSIIKPLEDYTSTFPNSSNYTMIWGEKEFLFSSLAKISTESANDELLNIALVSSFNTRILENYISNSIAGKNFIKTAFIIDESLKFQVLKHPESIENLEQEVQDNSYSYTSIGNSEKIAPYFFISSFINELSQKGVPISNIYIILLLPVFLTCISISKHMIGISPLGNIIPIFIGLLFIKIGMIFVLGVIALLIVFNIFFSKFIGKYTLLYTPKVACITIVNIVLFIAFYQIVKDFQYIHITLNEVLYVALFFIVSEKLITLISSKEFREYKKSLLGTLFISIICLMLYNFDILRVFLMAYPETILIFIPMNFLLGRFTGLRITEYFRFREIVKSLEE